MDPDAQWEVERYPHSGRYLVSNGALEGYSTRSIASFADEDDAHAFANARNEWERTAPQPENFGGCGPFPKPDRYEHGLAIFDSDPALRLSG